MQSPTLCARGRPAKHRGRHRLNTQDTQTIPRSTRAQSIKLPKRISNSVEHLLVELEAKRAELDERIKACKVVLELMRK
jgi:hypothetical protein